MQMVPIHPSRHKWILDYFLHAALAPVTSVLPVLSSQEAIEEGRGLCEYQSSQKLPKIIRMGSLCFGGEWISDMWQRLVQCTRYINLRPREFWMIIKGPSFFAIVWFGSTPAPSSVSKLFLFLSFPVSGGEGAGMEPNHSTAGKLGPL